jgi:hypothetical protein
LISDIFVSDTNVYIIGNIDDNYFDYYGQLWINGTLQNLADSGYWTYFNSIVVNNDDIYIAGYTTDSSSYQNKAVATLWKNEELIYELPHNLPNCYAVTMFINPDSLPNIAIPQQPVYAQNIKLYPNPAHSYITIELPYEITTADLQLFDLQGRQLKRKKITSKSTVNISRLQTGIYFYKIVAGKQRYNGKLLITR